VESNPCKQCLVQATCTDPCDKFEDYLYKTLNKRHLYVSNKFIAEYMRRGAMRLVNNDTDWIWKND